MSRLAASMVPPDLLLVAGSRVGWVWISLYYFNTSLHIDLMWLCFVSVRWSIVGFLWVVMMVCRSRIVLCMPLVLKVIAFMGGWRYSFVVDVLCSSILCFGVIGGCVGLRLGVSCVLCNLMYCSSVVCLYLDVLMDGFLWDVTLGAGKAMLMRGGACATELCFMVGCACLSKSNWCWLSCCGY